MPRTTRRVASQTFGAGTARVPFDMGGTVVTGINVKPYHGVRRCLGLPGQEPVMMDGRQQIAMVAMGCQICGLRRQN